MPKPKQETENDLCRCCHSEGAYKNLYASYSWVDVEEVVYSKLLQECFDIELAKVTQPLQNMLCTICDTCIERLQDAIKFKRQVQKCEKRFRDVYGSCVGEEATFEVKVKQEVDMDVKDDSLNGMHAHSSVMASSFQMMDDSEGCSGRDDDDDGFKHGGVKVKVEMDDSDSEDDIVLKDISEAKKRRGEPSRAAKTTPATSSKKSKKDGDGEIEVIQGMLVIDKRTKRKKKAESAVAPKKRKKEDSESDDEELVTIDGISVIKVTTTPVRKHIDYTRVGDSLQCTKCSVETKSETTMRFHVMKFHFNSSKYKCPTCFESFFRLKDLIDHNLNVHKIDNRFRCTACDKTFYEKRCLKSHIESFHMLGEKKTCKECGFETYLQSYYRKHVLCHSNVKNFQCSHCLKTFKRKSTLRLHERIHMDDRRKACAECGQAFVQRASLKYHMTKHHPGVAF